jgi:A/G-specific adenine glycosylase
MNAAARNIAADEASAAAPSKSDSAKGARASEATKPAIAPATKPRARIDAVTIEQRSSAPIDRRVRAATLRAMQRASSPAAPRSPLERPPSAREVAALRAALVEWYRAHKRDLPWRRTRDPYAIWISEAMLQQTRVETVAAYWTRFVARFPTLAALAAAGEDEVLAAWSGLGYYRRARALHQAARAIVEHHGGEFPREPELVRELPGVGPYTAGAVLSIAFDRPEPLVDGNVARVFCRLFAIDAEPHSRALRETLWDLARDCVPRDGGAGDWNQALMELGATICAPKEPRCLVCPSRELCRAFASGRTETLPRRERRRAPIEVELEVLRVARDRRDGGMLFERRPDRGRMSGMWQLPSIEVRSSSGLFPRSYACELEPRERLGEVRHTITHHRIRAVVRDARTSKRALPAQFAWFRRAELELLPLTGMTKKILRAPFALSC